MPISLDHVPVARIGRVLPAGLRAFLRMERACTLAAPVSALNAGADRKSPVDFRVASIGSAEPVLDANYWLPKGLLMNICSLTRLRVFKNNASNEFSAQFDGGMFQAEMKQARRQLTFPETAVESIAEFIEVFLQVGSGHTVEGTNRKRLRLAMAIGTHSNHSLACFEGVTSGH